MIDIDLRSRTPIYEQVVKGIERLILSGVLKPDEQLPSVRQMSKEMGINPNTISKAYQQLLKDNTIYGVVGRGSFVADKSTTLLERRKGECFEKIGKITLELKGLGVSEGEISAKVSEFYRGGNQGD